MLLHWFEFFAHRCGNKATGIAFCFGRVVHVGSYTQKRSADIGGKFRQPKTATAGVPLCQ